MKKWLKVALITFGILAVLIIVARMTKALTIFTVPTVASYPSIKPGDRIIASSLKKPERFKLIAFNHADPVYGKQVWLFRICGIAADTIEIRESVLYVNGQEVDSKLPLAHVYVIPQSEMSKLDDLPEFSEFYPTENGDSLIGGITTSLNFILTPE